MLQPLRPNKDFSMICTRTLPHFPHPINNSSVVASIDMCVCVSVWENVLLRYAVMQSPTTGTLPPVTLKLHPPEYLRLVGLAVFYAPRNNLPSCQQLSFPFHCFLSLPFLLAGRVFLPALTCDASTLVWNI